MCTSEYGFEICFNKGELTFTGHNGQPGSPYLCSTKISLYFKVLVSYCDQDAKKEKRHSSWNIVTATFHHTLYNAVSNKVPAQA